MGDKSFKESGIECCDQSLPESSYTCGLSPGHVGQHQDYYSEPGRTIYIKWVDPKQVVHSHPVNRDPFGMLTDAEQKQLDVDLAGIAATRRRVEAMYRNVPLA